MASSRSRAWLSFRARREPACSALCARGHRALYAASVDRWAARARVAFCGAGGALDDWWWGRSGARGPLPRSTLARVWSRDLWGYVRSGDLSVDACRRALTMAGDLADRRARRGARYEPARRPRV